MNIPSWCLALWEAWPGVPCAMGAVCCVCLGAECTEPLLALQAGCAWAPWVLKLSVCRQSVIPNKEVGKQCLLKTSVYCFSNSDRSEVENSLKISAPAEQTKGSVAFWFCALLTGNVVAPSAKSAFHKFSDQEISERQKLGAARFYSGTCSSCVLFSGGRGL